jgi:hypothetical protein
MARSVSREAATWFEQALVALQHLPESHATLEQAIDLRFNLRHALVTFGEAGRIFGALHEAERLAQTLDDQPRLGQVTAYLTLERREQTRTALSSVIALYRDTDMTFWLSQAEAALAQVRALG